MLPLSHQMSDNQVKEHIEHVNYTVAWTIKSLVWLFSEASPQLSFRAVKLWSQLYISDLKLRKVVKMLKKKIFDIQQKF